MRPERGGTSLSGADTSKNLPRFGLVASDALRSMGLGSILGDGERCEIVPLAPPFSANMDDLTLALIDTPAPGAVLGLVVAFRQIRPQLPVVVLGVETDPEHIERVIGGGAKGYLSHAASEAELKMAIDVVLDGSIWAPRKVMARLLTSSLQDAEHASQPRIEFTKREMEVLKLLVLGHPNRQIAELLGVDEGTVKAHMGRLMRKAGVDNRTALGMKAIERRWA